MSTAASIQLADRDPPARAGGAQTVRCLLVGADRRDRRLLDAMARASRHRIVFATAGTAAEARAVARDGAADLALVRDPLASGAEPALLADLAADWPGLPVIVLTDAPSQASAVAALRAGAADYLERDALTVEGFDRALADALGQGDRPAADPRSALARLSAENRALRRIALRNMRLLKGQALPVVAFAWKMVDSPAIADGERPGLVKRLARLTRTICGLIDDTVIFAATHRADEQETAVDLARLVGAILADAASGLGAGHAHIRVGPLPVLRGRPAQMRMLFEELLQTALRSGRLGKVPEIEIGAATDAEGNPMIWVAETGICLSARKQTLRDRFGDLVEPPADAKRDEHSWSLCQRIVEKNRGRFAIVENDPSGSRVTVRFPKAMLAG